MFIRVFYFFLCVFLVFYNEKSLATEDLREESSFAVVSHSSSSSGVGVYDDWEEADAFGLQISQEGPPPKNFAEYQRAVINIPFLENLDNLLTGLEPWDTPPEGWIGALGDHQYYSKFKDLYRGHWVSKDKEIDDGWVLRVTLDYGIGVHSGIIKGIPDHDAVKAYAFILSLCKEQPAKKNEKSRGGKTYYALALNNLGCLVENTNPSFALSCFHQSGLPESRDNITRLLMTTKTKIPWELSITRVSHPLLIVGSLEKNSSYAAAHNYYRAMLKNSGLKRYALWGIARLIYYGVVDTDERGLSIKERTADLHVVRLCKRSAIRAAFVLLAQVVVSSSRSFRKNGKLLNDRERLETARSLLTKAGIAVMEGRGVESFLTTNSFILEGMAEAPATRRPASLPVEDSPKSPFLERGAQQTVSGGAGSGVVSASAGGGEAVVPHVFTSAEQATIEALKKGMPLQSKVPVKCPRVSTLVGNLWSLDAAELLKAINETPLLKKIFIENRTVKKITKGNFFKNFGDLENLLQVENNSQKGADIAAPAPGKTATASAKRGPLPAPMPTGDALSEKPKAVASPSMPTAEATNKVNSGTSGSKNKRKGRK